jgi:hypothetical protein
LEIDLQAEQALKQEKFTPADKFTLADCDVQLVLTVHTPPSANAVYYREQCGSTLNCDQQIDAAAVLLLLLLSE